MAKLEIFYNNLSEINFSDDKRLSVVVSTDSLYCFISVNDKIFYIVKSHLSSYNEIIEIIQTLDEMNFCLNKELIYDHSFFSFIPESLYIQGNEKDYIKHIFNVPEGTSLLSASIGEHKLKNIFTNIPFLESILTTKFPEFKYGHAVNNLINQIPLDKWACIFCYFLDNYFYLIYVKNNLLISCNRNHFKSEKDVLFYVNKIVQEFEFTGKIILFGFIDFKSRIVNLLNTYFKNVSVFSNEIQINSKVLI